ncbi:MAG: hypothetical protein ACKVHR_06675 [Pirellulales bacterium]
MFRFQPLRSLATRLCLVAMFSLNLADFVRAELFTWTGGGVDSNWSTGANWDTGSAPTTGVPWTSLELDQCNGSKRCDISLQFDGFRY